ncbi:MAG: FAD-binding protein [Abditibacteriota bacterium]|nr:FAD-binding protein [Abditibacteriota bacterium]
MNTEYYDALIIGTGAAGYNAACRLAREGTRSFAVITEDVMCGTSRNTGSDKQTYYKLGLAGDSPDSIRKLAENLFAGGCVDGDTALCEAALSVRCFFNLTELGVPFPYSRYGEFVGYKTDHDPYARATSAGPLTSKYMTEALERQAAGLGVRVLDRLLCVEIIKTEGRVSGVIVLNRDTGALRAIGCQSLILATGGPAGIYAHSVYPACHTGSTGLAIDAGASLQNLTEWQYGLASTAPRWNVSGTYMQALPRFVSIDEEGRETEFLAEYFQDPYEALSMVFLKGYQWPFDSKKVLSGSSVIDLLVYRETAMRGRKVYLDYTRNPFGLEEIDYGKLADEAAEYLRNAGACFGKPIDRLAHMNTPAIELYRSKGVDIAREYLEIALCAQHNNGGIAVDKWWQTDVPGLFAAGECAGTHGITRPGGSALNAGQAGSLRAAQYVAAQPKQDRDAAAFEEAAEAALRRHEAFCARVLSNPDNAAEFIDRARLTMSACGGAIRSPRAMKQALLDAEASLSQLENTAGVAGPDSLFLVYKLRDLLTVQTAMLTACLDYADTLKATRGSALYCSREGSLREGLDEQFRFVPETVPSGGMVQQIRKEGSSYSVTWRPVRPLPEEDIFFENVWRRYQKDKNVY